MTEGHPSVEPAPDRHLGDVLGQREPSVGRIVGEIRVDVDRPVIGLGQVEDQVDMGPRVVDIAFGIRAAADHVGTQVQRATQQPLGPVRDENSLLRKGDDLQIDAGGVVGPQVQQRLERRQADDRIDVGVGPDERRAVADRHFDHSAAAPVHVVVGEGRLHPPGGADRVGE